MLNKHNHIGYNFIEFNLEYEHERVKMQCVSLHVDRITTATKCIVFYANAEHKRFRNYC